MNEDTNNQTPVSKRSWRLGAVAVVAALILTAGAALVAVQPDGATHSAATRASGGTSQATPDGSAGTKRSSAPLAASATYAPTSTGAVRSSRSAAVSASAPATAASPKNPSQAGPVNGGPQNSTSSAGGGATPPTTSPPVTTPPVTTPPTTTPQPVGVHGQYQVTLTNPNPQWNVMADMGTVSEPADAAPGVRLVEFDYGGCPQQYPGGPNAGLLAIFPNGYHWLTPNLFPNGGVSSSGGGFGMGPGASIDVQISCASVIVTIDY